MSSGQPIFTTKTTTGLLDALKDSGNEPAWIHIDARYRPVIRGLAHRLGLGHDDADEVAQHTLTEFVRAFREGRYDRGKGRLSSWILGIAHHSTLKLMRDRRKAASGGTDFEPATDERALRAIWDDERDRAIFNEALAMLRDESSVDDRTLLAFELVGLRGVPVSEAAAQCEMTTDQVYVAKSRVVKHMKRLVEQLTAAFEEDS